MNDLADELILLSATIRRASRAAISAGDVELTENLRQMAWATASLLAKLARKQTPIEVPT